MAGENLGANFTIDITDLKAGLAQANRLIRESESEFKAAAAGMDDWSTSQEGLEAKLKNLNTTADLQRTKVDALKKQYAELVSNGMNPASREAVELRTKINNETAALNKSEKAIADTEAALSELSTESGRAAQSVDDVADSANDVDDGFTVAKGAIAGFIANGLTALASAAKNAVTSILGLAESTREYRTELAKIETVAADAGTSTDYIKDKWHDLGAVLGDEGAVAEGLNNLVTAGFTTQEQMDAITGHLEGAAIKWKDTLKFEGLADGLQETLATGAAVGSFGEMLERAGVNLETFDAGLAECTTEAEKQNYVLDQLSKLGLNEVSEAYREQNADLIAANKANAEYNDKMAALGEKIEPITTKIREGFNGILEKVLELVNGVDLESFGAKIDEAFAIFSETVLPAIVDGLGWIVDNKDILIAGLAGIAAGFAAFKVATLIQGVVEAMKGMTVAQYALNLAMSLNPVGLVAAAIAGLVAAFIVLWNRCDGFREFWINLWEHIKTAFAAVVEWLKKAAGSIAEFFTEAWEKIKEIWDVVSEFFSGIWSGITDVFSGVGSWFKTQFTNAWNGVKSAWSATKSFFSGVWEGTKKIFAPVGSWFKTQFTNAWNGVKSAWSATKSFFSGVWEGTKQVFANAGSWFKTLFTNAWNGIKSAWSATKSFFSGVWSGIKDVFAPVTTWLKSKFETAKNSVLGVWNNIKSKFSGVWNNIKSAFAVGDFKTVGKEIVRGLWNGINDMAGWISKKIKSFGDNVLSGIKDFFGIESPSKLMRDEVGTMIAAGIGEGVEEGADDVNRTINNAMDIGGNSTGGVPSFGGTNGGRGNVVVNQNNYFSQAHSRAEIYRAKKQTAAAVRSVLAT